MINDTQVSHVNDMSLLYSTLPNKLLDIVGRDEYFSVGSTDRVCMREALIMETLSNESKN